MSDYKKLEVWEAAIELAVSVYAITERFPKSEMFGLTQQLRRAVVSISSLIAEGSGRASTRDQMHFLAEARGSLFEVESQLILSARLGYVNSEVVASQLPTITSIKRMINGLRRYLSRKELRKLRARRITRPR